MELKDRIKRARKSLSLSQQEFGDKIGVARNTVANYEIGIRTPMEQTLKSICREFGVDYIWLTTGEGNMFADTNQDVLQVIDRLLSNEDDFTKRVFKAFAHMDERDWKALKKFVDLVSGEK